MDHSYAHDTGTHCGIPLIVGLFYLPIETAERNLWATVMFVVFALTDWLDGYLARKLNQ